MTSTVNHILGDPVAQRLLTSRIPARLAYCWKDGTPRVVPILFHWNGEEIVMCTPDRAPKLRALHDGDAVAVTIDSDEFPYKVLSVRGDVRLEPVSGVAAEYSAGVPLLRRRRRGGMDCSAACGNEDVAHPGAPSGGAHTRLRDPLPQRFVQLRPYRFNP